MHIIMAYVILAVCSFLLHVAWERLHIALYTGYEALKGVLPVYLFATLGDVGYTLLVVLAVAIVRRDVSWMMEIRTKDYLMLAAIGLAVALFVEAKARMYGRWEYTEAMPTVWGFGISPLVQMTVLLPLSVFITMVVIRYFSR